MVRAEVAVGLAWAAGVSLVCMAVIFAVVMAHGRHLLFGGAPGAEASYRRPAWWHAAVGGPCRVRRLRVSLPGRCSRCSRRRPRRRAMSTGTGLHYWRARTTPANESPSSATNWRPPRRRSWLQAFVSPSIVAPRRRSRPPCGVPLRLGPPDRRVELSCASKSGPPFSALTGVALLPGEPLRARSQRPVRDRSRRPPVPRRLVLHQHWPEGWHPMLPRRARGIPMDDRCRVVPIRTGRGDRRLRNPSRTGPCRTHRARVTSASRSSARPSSR